MISQLIEKSIEYLKGNLILGAVLVGICAALIITLVVLICTAPKRKKARKQKKADALAKAQHERNIQEHAEAERKQAQAIEAAQKAEQERIAFEKAEQERLAAEKAKQERIAAEKAEQERLEAEAQKAQQDHAEEKAIDKADADAEAEEKAILDAVNKRTQQDLEKQAKKAASKAKEEKPATEKTPAKTVKAPSKAGTRQTLQPTLQETETTAKKGYNGKWVLYRLLMQLDDGTSEEMYYFELHASNGEKLLSSEEYTTYAGAMRGIQTHKNNIEKGNFKITISKKGDYIFKLLSGKNMLLCMGENYPTLARCESAVQSTQRFAKTAVIEETMQTRTIKVLAEDDAELPPLPDGYNGKWVIDSTENALGEQIYYFELYANNGEKLLSSEEYTTYIGAVNGIQTHKTNIERNNFRISLTKRGDYIYKLLNGNGQLLSLGEHYKTKRLCQNAVESVRRFALNSPILTDPKLMK